MDNTTIAVIGTGFMGVQIACKALASGSTVRTYDPDVGAAERAVLKLKGLFSLLGQAEKEKELDDTWGKVFQSVSLAEAVTGSDIVIEAVSEKPELKKQVLSEVEAASPAHAIIGSNSSSIPVTRYENALATRHRLLNIHFDAPLLDKPLVDIMPGSQTTPETLETARSWIKHIGCSPVIVKKPIMGYLGNRLWRAVKRESLKLWAEGYGDYKEIDRSWMLQIGVDTGPFGMMDVVGLDVVYDIEMIYFNDSLDPQDKPPDALKAMIEQGELGLKTGRGFYDWTDPEFLKPGFLSGE